MTQDVNRVLEIVRPDDPGYEAALEACVRIWCLAAGNRPDAPLHPYPPVYSEIEDQARQAVGERGLIIVCRQMPGTETLQKKKKLKQESGEVITIPAAINENPCKPSTRIIVGTAIISDLPAHKQYLAEELPKNLPAEVRYLGRVGVLPNFEGQGIFQDLLEKAESVAFEELDS